MCQNYIIRSQLKPDERFLLASVRSGLSVQQKGNFSTIQKEYSFFFSPLF